MLKCELAVEVEPSRLPNAVVLPKCMPADEANEERPSDELPKLLKLWLLLKFDIARDEEIAEERERIELERPNELELLAPKLDEERAVVDALPREWNDLALVLELLRVAAPELPTFRANVPLDEPVAWLPPPKECHWPSAAP